MKYKMVILCCIIVFLLFGNGFQFVWNNYANRLPVDAVPNEVTALEIGKAVLMSVSLGYDVDTLDERSFDVTFNNRQNVWIITSSLPDGYLGGVSEIIIRKSDGKIIKIYLGA